MDLQLASPSGICPTNSHRELAGDQLKWAVSPWRSFNGRFVMRRLTSRLRLYLRAPPKRATQEPADAVSNPESEHGRKRNACHDKPKLRL